MLEHDEILRCALDDSKAALDDGEAALDDGEAADGKTQDDKNGDTKISFKKMFEDLTI